MALTDEQKKKMQEGRERARAAKKAAEEAQGDAQDEKLNDAPQEGSDEETIENADGETKVEPADEHSGEHSSESSVETSRERELMEEIKHLREQQKELERLRDQAVGQPTIMMAKTEDMVTIVYLDSVAPDNRLSLGDFGYINAPGSMIEITKKDFTGRFLTPSNRALLDKRLLVVCDGLTENERFRFNVAYREGEILDHAAFEKLLGYDTEIVTKMFSKLCREHREMVARIFATAYERGDNRVSRAKVESLNRISKEDDREGMFSAIIQLMNESSMTS